MPIDSITSLLDVLKELRLLEATQLDETAANLQARFPSGQALARELVRRGWLTPYQVNQVFQGRARDLLLGSYVLIERLGEGGMGQVFKARNWKLRKTVAIKLIRKERLASADAVRRFHREIQAAAKLDHLNIVRAYDADEVNGTHFFVMEHVEGADLSKLVKERGPLPVAETCGYIRMAALGLQHACERGLVHRDIKPNNLLLSKDGVVKILDMGLARIEAASSDSESTSTLTQEGAVMGTLDFIAPEQALDAHKVDIRADLYSLGCTFYFLLTGQVPFPGGSALEKLIRQREQQPPPIEGIRADVAEAVTKIVYKLMAKNPAERYQMPAELAAVLEKTPTEHMVQAKPVLRQPVNPFANLETSATLASTPNTPPPKMDLPSSRRSPFRFFAACMAVVVIAVFAWGLIRGIGWFQSSEQRDGPGKVTEGSLLDQLDRSQIPEDARADWRALDWQPPKEIVAVLGEHRQRHCGAVKKVAVSPDGKLVASAGDDAVIRLWHAETMQLHSILVGHSGAITGIAFAPDGRNLASCNPLDVFIWDLTARPAKKRRISGNPGPNDIAYSPNGKLLAITSAHAIRLYDLSGDEPKLQTVLAGHTSTVFSIHFAPNGRTLASCGGDGTVRMWDINAPKEGRIVITRPAHSCVFFDVAFAPDGKTLAAGNQGEGTLLWDVTGAEPKEQAILKATALCAIYAVAFSTDCKTLAVGYHSTGLIELWDVSGAKPVKKAAFKGHWEGATSLTFAPNGRVLFSGGLDGTVRRWDLTKEQPEEQPALVGHQGLVRTVAFAPDGRSLASGGDDSSIKLWDLATRRESQALRGHSAAVWSVAFTPDGKRLASGSADHTARIWDSSSGKGQAVLNHDRYYVHQVAFSSSGNLLACASGAQTNGELVVWDLQKDPVVPRFRTRDYGGNNLYAVGFSSTGNRVFSGSFNGSVRVWDAATGAVLNSLQVVSSLRRIAISPDEKRLAVWGNGDSGRVYIWDLTNGKKVVRLDGHVGITTGIAYSPRGDVLASSTDSGQLFLWNANSGDKLYEWKFPGGIHDIAFTADGRHLATANGNGTVYVFRLADAASPFDQLRREDIRWQQLQEAGGGDPAQAPTELVAVFGPENFGLDDKAESGIRAVAIGLHGRQLVMCFGDGNVRVWDVAAKKIAFTFPKFAAVYHPIATVSPNGKLLAYSSANGKLLRVCQLETGVEQLALDRSGNGGGVVFSPDSERVYSGFGPKRVKGWTVEGGKEVLDFPVPIHVIYGLAFSPDGSYLAVVGSDAPPTIVDATTGTQKIKLEDRSGGHRRVAFSPDGRQIATVIGGGISVANADTGQFLFSSTHGYGKAAVDLCFHPHGTWFASSASDGLVLLWDTKTGQKLRSMQLPGSVTDIEVTPDGRHLAALGGGKVYILRLQESMANPAAKAER